MTTTTLTLALAALLIAAPAAYPGEGGGMAGLGGKVFGPTDHDEHEKPGAGSSVPTKPRTHERHGPERKDRAKELAEQIARFETQIAEMEKVKWGDVNPVDSVEEAEAFVGAIRKTYERTRADLDAADRTEAGKAKRLTREFNEKWEKHLKKSHKDLTMDDLMKGKMPEGMDPLAWAGLCDQFYHAAAELEAQLAETGRGLSDKRRRQLAELKETAERAEQWLGKWKEDDKKLTGSARTLTQREMAYRAHIAKLVAARRALHDLKALQAERSGKVSGREDPMAAEMYVGTGLWMSDELKNKV